MKNLKIEEMDLVELNQDQAKEVNGGSLLAWFIGIVVVGSIVDAIFDLPWLVTPVDAFRE